MCPAAGRTSLKNQAEKIRNNEKKKKGDTTERREERKKQEKKQEEEEEKEEDAVRKAEVRFVFIVAWHNPVLLTSY